MAKKCLNCGTLNQDTDKFCQSCGDELPIEESGVLKRFGGKKNTNKIIIGVFGACCIGLIILIAIGGMVSPDHNTINNGTNPSNSQPTNTTNTSSGYKVFENQYVKFNVPNGITVVDDSTDTDFSLTFMKGSEMIGDMGGLYIDPTVYEDLVIKAPNEYYKTTIAGYSAVEGKGKVSIEAYIPTGGKTGGNGNLLGISFSFDNPYSSEYNIVKNSLVIKKTPT